MSSLYKFKSCDNIVRILELLESGEFYCADFRELNDPMEGAFDVKGVNRHNMQLISDNAKIIYDEKTKFRILSLTDRNDSIYMLAHYADGFKGIALEIEVGESEYDEAKLISYRSEKLLYQVQYSKNIDQFDVEVLNVENFIVQKALTTKLEEWHREYEYRYLVRGKSITLKIKRVILGLKMNSHIRETIVGKSKKKGYLLAECIINRTTNKVNVFDV